jgi:hypothetical protein
MIKSSVQFSSVHMHQCMAFMLCILLHAVVGITANDHRPTPAAVFLASLKVNSLQQPISIDERPSFSFTVDVDNGGQQRGVVTEGFELELDELQPDGSVAPVWRSGIVQSNQTQFIQWPASCSCSPPPSLLYTSGNAQRNDTGRDKNAVPSAACPQRQLSSDSDYAWRVRAYPGPSEWSVASFSTGQSFYDDAVHQ